jgi:hypothetical protein
LLIFLVVFQQQPTHVPPPENILVLTKLPAISGLLHLFELILQLLSNPLGIERVDEFYFRNLSRTNINLMSQINFAQIPEHLCIFVFGFDLDRFQIPAVSFFCLTQPFFEMLFSLSHSI